jgi:hypothetical protein
MPTGVYERTAEYREKQRLAHVGRKPYVMTAAIRRKIALGQLGRKHSQDTRRKMSDAHKGRAPYVVTLEVRKHMSAAHMGKQARERNPNWRGGKTLGFYYGRQRRLRLYAVGEFHTSVEWESLKALYDRICPSCIRREPEIKLTKDHIVPISRGGGDGIANIQPLCRRCNSRKSKSVIKYEIPNTETLKGRETTIITTMADYEAAAEGGIKEVGADQPVVPTVQEPETAAPQEEVKPEAPAEEESSDTEEDKSE